jgi:3-deoxy-D-manno-octulosonic-acid transferase
MMRFLYNSSIHFLSLLLRFSALFHPKAKLFVHGRMKIFERLRDAFSDKKYQTIWIHCASLGEFEQGRPVIESFRKNFPAAKILLTFFSPSGYEVRKNFPGVDFVFYLPLDTPRQARDFIGLTHPILAIFVKYEFWYNYSRILREKNIPMISIASIFRPDQVFFKFYGSFFRTTLRNFHYFFVQDVESVNLLKSIGLTNVAQAGDTRFDRVYQLTKNVEEIALAKNFKGSEKVMVIGSCWPEDFEVLAPFINENRHRLKFILAPHEITEEFLSSIERSVEGKTIRFSGPKFSPEESNVLLIDNVGMLSQLYWYGEFAYVGGGFGRGLHNILEAACYGVPIFFGDQNYEKFKEARDLILRGGAFDVRNFSDLKTKYEMLLNRPENFLLACEVTKQYVQENLGATKKIMDYCQQFLNP